MTLRIRIILVIFIVIIVAVLIGVGIWLFSFFSKKNNQSQPPVTLTNTFPPVEEPPLQEPTPSPTPAPAPVPQVTQEQQVTASIASFVLPFVERFGSFSNQNNFENLNDLLPFMTVSMKAWAQRQINEAQGKPIPEIYKGVTTRTLNHEIKSMDLDGGVAEFLVHTQRKELVGTSTNFRTYNQDVLIRLKREKDVWLVDGAFWQ